MSWARGRTDVRKLGFQSQGKEYNVILTVVYRDRVLAYHKEFKKNLAESDYEINIAMTFSFGNEQCWMKYTGAYKNLRYSLPGDDDEENVPVVSLVGRTKLSGTQVIDANYILKLIGDRVSSEKGVLTVDTETLSIIHQQIQELSDMGENNQAVLLKEFVGTELVKGKLSSNYRFDALFEDWRQGKVEKKLLSLRKTGALMERYCLIH